MVCFIRKGFRLLTCERWCAVLLGALVLMVLASSCSGGEARKEQAEQRGERKQPPERKVAPDQGEESGTTQRSEPGARQEKPRASLVWVAAEAADQIALVDS
jgi:hypothetical protein